MRLHLSVGALALALSACGGASHAPTTPSTQPEEAAGSASREVVGDACIAQYVATSDITVAVIEVPSVGLVAVPVLGDGWTFDCRVRGRQLLIATNERSGRYATLVVDPGATEIPDLTRYASEHGQAMAENMDGNGITDIRMGEPTLVDERTYVIVIGGAAQEARFVQFNAFSLAPTAIGLLRVHISEISDDGQALNDHAEALVAAARAFGPVPDDD